MRDKIYEICRMTENICSVILIVFAVTLFYCMFNHIENDFTYLIVITIYMAWFIGIGVMGVQSYYNSIESLEKEDETK